MEKETKKKILVTSGRFAFGLLAVVGATGIVVTGAMCPGLLRLIPRTHQYSSSRKSIYRTVHRLDRQGFIVIRQQGAKWKIHLTKKGKEELRKYELGQKHLQKPRRWDKKWRMLIFDVPEKYKWLREKIRRTLLTLGFVRLQDSVWAYPYECRDVLDLLRTRDGARANALYLRVEQLDHDDTLRKQFGLL